LEGEHLLPLEQIVHLQRQHHVLLQKGYDEGVFLFSGPQVPAHGGFLVARAESLEELERYLADEPFTKAKAMRFSRITEFNPLQHHPMVEGWFK
jgi:uncharacterized protein YciI